MLKAKELVRTNVMLDKKLLKLIDEYAEAMSEDRSTIIRQLIKKAILDEKVNLAIRKYKEGAPFRKAADIAGLDYWDFQAELDKREVPITASLSFARKRLKQIKE